LGRARPDEARDTLARGLVELGRALAERVDRAVDVRVGPLVVVADGVEHGERLLRARGAVEIDERAGAVPGPEDRKIRLHGACVETHDSDVRQAAWWIRPFFSRSGTALRPCWTARISASTESAISAGASAPRSRPIGVRTCAARSGETVTPSARISLSICSVRARGPSAPR